MAALATTRHARVTRPKRSRRKGAWHERRRHGSIAHELLAAYRTGKTLPPLTSTYTGPTVDDAYAIQQRQTDTRTNAGAGIVGFTIGRTSAAMQQQLGVDQPDYGHLFTDMLHAPDTPIPTSAFLQPRAEPEIALVLAHTLQGRDSASPTSSARPPTPCPPSRSSTASPTGGSAWKTPSPTASSGGLVLGSAPPPRSPAATSRCSAASLRATAASSTRARVPR